MMGKFSNWRNETDAQWQCELVAETQAPVIRPKRSVSDADGKGTLRAIANGAPMLMEGPPSAESSELPDQT